MKHKIVLLILLLMRSLMFADITWSGPSNLSSVSSSFPAVAIDTSGNYYAIWIQNFNVFASVNGGVPTALTTSGTSLTPVSNLGIVVQSTGTATALWLFNGIVQTRTYLSTPLPAWSVTTITLGLPGGSSSPTIAVDINGNMAASWVDSTGIRVANKAYMVPYDGPWPSLTTLSGTVGGTLPQVGINGGNTIVVWVQNVSSINVVYSAIGNLLGGFGLNLSISNASINSSYPQVKVNSSGQALACWFQYTQSGNNFSNVSLYFSFLSGASWTTFLPVGFDEEGSVVDPQTLVIAIGLDNFGGGSVVWTQNFTGSTYNTITVKWSFTDDDMITNPTTLVADDMSGFGVSLSTSYVGYTPIVGMITSTTTIPDVVIQAVETMTTNFDSGQLTGETILSNQAFNGYPAVAVSDNGTNVYAAAVWVSNTSSVGVPIIQVATGTDLVVNPPTSLTVAQSSTFNGVFTNYFNTFSWTEPGPSLIGLIVGYNVYRNGLWVDFIDSVAPSSTLSYIDNNQLAGVHGTVYSVVSVTGNGFFSAIENVTY